MLYLQYLMGIWQYDNITKNDVKRAKVDGIEMMFTVEVEMD